MPLESDSEAPPPPINHVLRPHHIGLLAVILLSYRRNMQPSPSYMLHIQQILIEEIAETSAPKPYQTLIRDLCQGYSGGNTTSEVISMQRALVSVPTHLDSIDSLHDFFNDIQNLVVEKDEEERRSFFGLFCRRCCVSYYKLSFPGVVRLHHDFIKWSCGNIPAGYQIQDSNRKWTGHLLFPTAADDKDYGTASAFKNFQNASHTGDTPHAMEQLRNFFDQHFSDTNESGLRQHALLNLALYHFSNKEYVAARKVNYLLEAITVARTSSDRVTLQHCMSLLRRFVPREGSSVLPLTEIQANTSATYVASDVLKLIVQSKEPILASFARILQAWACFDSSTNWKGGPPPEQEQWYIHSVQSYVWKISGPASLSEPEENIVLSFTRPGAATEARWDALRSRAERCARQGDINTALEILLDPVCWRPLDLRQYNEWAGVIWRILVLRQTRRGQTRQFHEFLKDVMPSTGLDSEDPPQGTLPPLKSKELSPLLDRDAILHGKLHYKGHNALTAIQFLLRGLFAAEFRGHWPMYRIGTVLLADLAGDFGMRKYGRRLLDEIMPQIVAGDDIELRAFACFVMARCIVLASDGQVDAVRQAIPYLQRAEEDYKHLEMFTCLQDVFYFAASVYNTLGMVKERDMAALDHADFALRAESMVEHTLDPDVVEIWSIVTEVGAKLAAGGGIVSIT
ncbi:hypothetical protein M422DRAFT_169075 [Sphaerobolus stellatus SS14]|uniref:Anaphase-promoting complex subunit 5 n=1 Tax=Sphaerobolus stellatus (strain SS14) TaxID=990650 RepID=A0A0C9UM64_SPHS4|nr:hypothetical protein M422DRAFT_169075 [Sphaerobolus stellatus SS14]